MGAGVGLISVSTDVAWFSSQSLNQSTCKHLGGVLKLLEHCDLIGDEVPMAATSKPPKP